MDCDPVIDNPNLYVTLTESVDSGYLLAEDGALLLTQNADNLYHGQ
jgi:hypothetical protein